MINLLKQSVRNLERSKLLLFVSMPGLVIGLTAALLLIFYIKFESSFDEFFPNKQRVVRLYNADIENGTLKVFPICLREAYTVLPEQIPEIEAAAQIYRWGKSNIILNNKRFINQRVLYADQPFFKVFGLNLIEGEKNRALAKKNSVVITNTLAQKLFSNNNCLGKIIKINDDEFTVTGIVNEMPVNTHFHFDLLASMSTLNQNYFGGLEFFTYYLLKNQSAFNQANKKISSVYNQILKNHFDGFMENPKSGIEPLTSLHMHTIADFDLSEKADIKGMYIMGILVAFILLIAIVNHVNLFVLYGEKRSLETGIRKSFGAGFLNLAGRLYFETTLFTTIAFALSFLLIAILLPRFANLIYIDISQFHFINPVTITGSIVVFIVIILLAGSYPAVYLSKINIINAIKGGSGTKQRKKILALISVLVQFTISIFLITVLLIIHAQLSYLKKYPLGFNTENVIGISGFDNKIRSKNSAIKEELKKLPFVIKQATSAHFMGGGCSGQMLYNFGQSEYDAKDINEYRVQAGFCETMQFDLLKGRFFNGTPDDKSCIILNQKAVQMLGLKNPIGKSVVMFDDPMKIIGVVKDFYYFENAGEPVEPLALTAYSDRVNVFYLKIKDKLDKQKLQQIKAIFNRFDPDYHFNFFELTDIYNRKFSREDNLLMVVFYGTLVALLLAFGGMFALSFFNVERRTKEIGIRKVLGSTSAEVLLKLLKDILIWVIWAMIPAFLIAYMVMKQWLANFANKINITFVYFLMAGTIALLIAVAAISIQSIRAARQNPVKTLRYE
jgi:putative ABC transport system permease protein